MKTEKAKTKIGALAVVALLLIVTLPSVSAGPYEEAREKYKTAKNKFSSAYSDWLTARSGFIDSLKQWRQNRTKANLANAKSKAKTALLKVNDLMIKRVKVLRARAKATRGLFDNEMDNIENKIDRALSWLGKKEAKIKAAKDKQAIKNIAIQTNDQWRRFRVKIKQITGQLLNAKTNAIFNKAEAFAARIEAKIDELENSGVDVTKLESWLSNYNSKLDLAEQKYVAAKEKFNKVSSPDDAAQLSRKGVALIKKGNSYLKDAVKTLKDIFSEMKSEGHTVKLSGSGTLIAKGDGSTYISGTGMIRVRAPIQGTMTVSPNAEVTTDGTGTKTVLDNDWVKYQGYGGAKVTGTDITVKITGDGINILAAGTGSVVLKGTGTYRTYGNKYWSGNWTAEGVTAELATGEVSTEEI